MASFEDAEIGDRFAVSDNLGNYQIVQVERLTPKYIVSQHGQKWRKSDGELAGADTWHRRRLEEITEKVVETIKIQRAKRYMANLSVPDEMVVEIAEYIKGKLEGRKNG